MSFPSPLIDIALVIVLIGLLLTQLGRRVPVGAAILLVCAVLLASAGIVQSVVGGWHSDFATSLRITVFATVLMGGIAWWFVWPGGMGLHALLAPYAIGILGLAWLLGIFSVHEDVTSVGGPWLITHIIVAVLSYAAITLAAIAGLSVTLSAYVLKHRREPNALEAALPSVVEAETMQDRLLLIGGLVLGVGLATGVSLNIVDGLPAINWTHKTFLLIGAFLLIAAILTARRLFDIRGRIAARAVLIAFLLVTLGYPGVKLIVDIVMHTG